LIRGDLITNVIWLRPISSPDRPAQYKSGRLVDIGDIQSRLASAIALLGSSHFAWIIAVCWVLLPPLVIATLFFWARDLSRPNIRKQALAAFLISLPVFALEICFFTHLNL
jgi:hypothetical protein